MKYATVREAFEDHAVRKAYGDRTEAAVLHAHPQYGERVYYIARLNWKEDPDWVDKLDKRFAFYRKKHGVGNEIREIVLYSADAVV